MSGFDAGSAAANAILKAGYPPDIVSGAISLWGLYWAQFWKVTQCQWQKRFDPTWTTYLDGPNGVTNTGGYDYLARVAQHPEIFNAVAGVATTGKIKKPLITVAGTMDALLPIQDGARAYERLVDRSRKGNNEQREAQYRLYEVQNGNPIDTFHSSSRSSSHRAARAEGLRPPRRPRREQGAAASQCVPRGGAIQSAPSQPGHCANLFVP